MHCAAPHKLLKICAFGKNRRGLNMIDEAKIEAALCAKLCTTQLTEEEVKIWSDRFAEKMTKSTPEGEAFFAERRRKAAERGE
jgi:hypothetical protein